MESQRQIQRKYEKLMSQVANDDFYKVDVAEKINCYSCNCGRILKTKFIDAGVTPMFIKCDQCKGTAQSSGYIDLIPEQPALMEWYRPALSEVMKYRSRPDILTHIFSGGLSVRKTQTLTIVK
jgi:hypothetical protein